jgi:3-oxoacyl-[acyl-carrier protein] reductase
VNENYNIVATYNKNRKVLETLQKENGNKLEIVQLDINDSERFEEICENINTKHKHLDILINTAAVNIEFPAIGMEDDQWNTVMNTNLTSAFKVSQIAAKYMLLNKFGKIIHISSIAARSGGRGMINYAVSKAGLESMIRVFALELGRKGILVNAVAPGVIETSLSERIRNEYESKLLERISVGRFGKPIEVANAIKFLCSEEASYINGQVLYVDGGFEL